MALSPAFDSSVTPIAIAAAVILFLRWVNKSSHTVPSVTGSWLPWKWEKLSDLVERGCVKYNNVFRVYLSNRWLYVIGNRDLIEDFRRAQDDELSPAAILEEVLQFRYTFGLPVDDYHVPVIQQLSTRKLASKIPELHEEIQVVFDQMLPPRDMPGDWVGISMTKASQKAACQVSSRLLVGLPLCRDKDYQDMNINFTIAAMITVTIFDFLPSFLRPAVGRIGLINRARLYRQWALEMLGPIVDERLRQAEEQPDASDKPDDLITWCIEAAGDGPIGALRKTVDDQDPG